MKHNLELTTVELLLVSEAIKHWKKEEQNQIDIQMSDRILSKIRGIVETDLG